MKKILMVLSIAAVFTSFNMVRAGTTSCSASASCSNECDIVSLSITGDSGCTCSCTGQCVNCTALHTIRADDPAHQGAAGGTTTENIHSDNLKDCTTQGGGEGGGSGPGENTNDLSWCPTCYDSNGNLTPLGEFFAGQV